MILSKIFAHDVIDVNSKSILGQLNKIPSPKIWPKTSLTILLEGAAECHDWLIEFNLFNNPATSTYASLLAIKLDSL